jgi:hypothetical protein
MKCLVILLSLIIWGCNQKPNSELADNKFDVALSNGKNSSVRSDYIFMDFHFGQTRAEVKEHYKKLAKEKILQICGDGAYRDIITLDPTSKYYNNIAVTISEDYFENRLYDLTLSLKNDSNNELLDNSVSPLMMYDAYKAFKTKYPQTIWRTNKNKVNGYLLSFEGVENNRYIKIISDEEGHVLISYINLITIAKIDSANQVKKSQDYKKTLKIL